ncbi:MAG: hypothetical protein WD750_12810 [Gammaproteobacteria bacterium]
MKYKVLVLLLMYAILPAAGVAQETDRQETEVDERQEDEQVQTDGEDNNDGKSSPAIRDSFRPSEEISEDLSVSFPVDI